MKLLWSDRARRDLGGIARYISRDNPDAARRWIATLRSRAREALDNPRGGRRMPELARDDIREIIHRRYRIVYRIGNDTVEILTVFEGHRRLPIDS